MKKKNDNKKQNPAKQNSDKREIEQDLIQEADQEIEEIDSAKQNEDQKIARLEDQLRRAVADYQNLEKRTEEKRSEWIMTSNASLVKKLLPVLDNLFLAQKHIKDDGLDLSVQKFLEVLQEEGVEQIETKDRNFDPHLMECITVAEGEGNKVLEEVRKGFIMKDIVLRPAQVIVGGNTSV